MLALPAVAADLSLHRVMLSAAGVGYFEFQGKVAGAATLGIDVPLGQVDDVLRSLAVFDDHGGVGTIELPGRDDSNEAFSDVPFGEETLNSPADLLQSLRGDEVAVSGPDAMTGRIVSAAAEPLLPRPTGNDTAPQPATHTRVTLLTSDGLRQFILEDAASVRLTDADLRARVGAALDAARRQTAGSFRHLTLRSTGDGTRSVSVGYVVAVPLWKASYRVVLPAHAGDKARLQGWAVLENQSGSEWKGVDLTLQSGNPVTFHQAIYASYFADRPEVPVEVLGHILPDADVRAVSDASRPAFRGHPGLQPNMRRFGGAMRSDNLDHGTPVEAAPMAVPGGEEEVSQAKADFAPPSTMTAATESIVDTSFRIANPIDLARGHSASVPILDRQMPAEQVDWLQANSSRPVTAVRITNDGATSLPPGALTLYTTDPASGVAFAGDARLGGLPAGESRLLAFAEDLRATATRSRSSAPNVTLHVTVAHGLLRSSMRFRTIYTVDLAAPVHDARRMLIDFVKTPDIKFSVQGNDSSGLEETAAAWRVAVQLKAGEVRHLIAYEDRDVATAEALMLSDGRLNEYLMALVLTEGKLDPAAQEKLRGLLRLRDAVTERQDALHHLTGQQSDANADEQRIRDNLRVVAAPGDLHDKLLAGLDADETKLADLRTRIAQAQSEADAAHAKLADAVNSLEF
jgi:hypothetical protein